MNTLLLKYAVEIDRTKSISQAADNLFMAQPNLSKAIKELEESLGIVIFERTPRGVFPTQKGIEFLSYAKNILGQLEKIEALYVPRNPEKQYFSISIPRGSYIAEGFMKFMAGFDFTKDIDVNIREANSMQVISSVTENVCNFGIIRYQAIHEPYFLDYLKEKQLYHDPIWEFEYLAVMSRRHPLASAKSIQYTELKKFIEIVHGDTVIPYLSKSKKSEGHNHPIKSVFVHERCSLFDILEYIPATYSWASPVPARLLEKYSLTQRKSDFPDRKCKDLLIYPRGYKFSALDKKFIDKLYAAKNEAAFTEYF